MTALDSFSLASRLASALVAAKAAPESATSAAPARKLEAILNGDLFPMSVFRRELRSSKRRPGLLTIGPRAYAGGHEFPPPGAAGVSQDVVPTTGSRRRPHCAAQARQRYAPARSAGMGPKADQSRGRLG